MYIGMQYPRDKRLYKLVHLYEAVRQLPLPEMGDLHSVNVNMELKTRDIIVLHHDVIGFIVNGITNVDTTSWEVRYGFSSKTVSLITVAYDTAAGILVLPITYFGARAHQMRMLAFAALIMASGSLVMVIAHWADGVYQLGTSMSFTCSDNLGQCFTFSQFHSCLHITVGHIVPFGHIINTLGHS